MPSRIRFMYATALVTALVLAAAHGHAQLTAAPSTAAGNGVAATVAVAPTPAR
jgi:hypothetical protein